MLQAFIAGDTLQLVLHNLLHHVLDAVVVFLHLLLHAFVAVLVREVRDDGNALVGFRLGYWCCR